MIPLFQAYPALGERLPHASLAELPTPIRPWAPLAAEFEIDKLHVKCDDVTGLDYGGNKVRKLEFLLGAALARGARSTVTFGAAGSNHALATAIYARNVGLQPISMLVPQHNAHSVRRNLLRGYAAGADLRHFLSRRKVSLGTIDEVLRQVQETGRRPYIIPAGGSSPLGTVGFVNAAFELRDQIAAGEMPEPDALYVASGTMGTCVGLLIGLAATGLRTRIEAVRVTSPPFTSLEKARSLFARTVGLLRKSDPSFPALEFPEAQFRLRDGFLGESYGRHTEAGNGAVERAEALAGAHLEGTYTGKALACLLADGRDGHLWRQNVLFWNTYNSRDFQHVIENVDYCQLPAAFHRYFEEPVQGHNQ